MEVQTGEDIHRDLDSYVGSRIGPFLKRRMRKVMRTLKYKSRSDFIRDTIDEKCTEVEEEYGL